MPGKHQHFQEPEVGCCGKYFLFGFNIVFWVSVGWVPGPVLGGDGEKVQSPTGERTLSAWDGRSTSSFFPPVPSRPSRGPPRGNYGEAQIAGGRVPATAGVRWGRGGALSF